MSTMEQQRLDNLMILFCERDIVDQLSIQKAVEKWVNVRWAICDFLELTIRYSVLTGRGGGHTFAG